MKEYRYFNGWNESKFESYMSGKVLLERERLTGPFCELVTYYYKDGDTVRIEIDYKDGERLKIKKEKIFINHELAKAKRH